MKRKSLFIAAILGLTMGASFSQNASPDLEEKKIPEYINRFTNLPAEKRKAYSEHKGKAEQFFRQKRTFESLDQIHQAQKIFDEDPSLWNLEGSCHVEFRSFEKARRSFQRALAIDSDNIGVLFNLAEMDFVTKEWKDCIAKMTALIERLEEKSGDKMEVKTQSLYDLALFKKMLAMIRLDQVAEARQLAEDNWEEWDDTPFTYYSKAALAYQDDNQEEANRWIRSAIRVFGGMTQVANWQDTLIEFGFVKSFYGGDESDDIELSDE